MAMPSDADGAPSAERQAANLAEFGLVGSQLPHQEPSDRAAEATQPAANAQLAELEKKLLAMQQAITDQNQRHHQELQRLQAASTAVPPSMAGASSAAASGAPPAPLPPDKNWQADFADIDVDWGDMDPEQLNKLKTDKMARTAFVALWQQPKNKKNRKYDPVAQTTNQVDNYNSGSSTDHKVSDISDTFSEDPALWNEIHHTMLFTLIIAALAFSEATQQWSPPYFPTFC